MREKEERKRSDCLFDENALRVVRCRSGQLACYVPFEATSSARYARVTYARVGLRLLALAKFARLAWTIGNQRSEEKKTCDGFTRSANTRVSTVSPVSGEMPVANFTTVPSTLLSSP